MPKRELEQLRIEQQKKVMREIGGLLDAWDGLSNDVKSQIAEESTAFIVAISRICIATEG